MKRIILSLVVLALVGCGGKSSQESAGDTGTAGENAGTAAMASGSDEDVVVYVNGAPILRGNVERLAQTLSQRNIAPDPEVEGDTPEERLFNSAQRILENQQLVLQSAADQGITASPEEVNAQLTQVQMSAGGVDAFNTQIASQGITEDEIKDQIAHQLISREYFAKLSDTMEVSPDEIQAFYDTSGLYTPQPQVRARHILKQVSPDADQATKDAVLDDIKRVKGRIDAGEAFEEVAKSESEGPSAPNGGDLGYFNRGAMVPPFDEVAFSLEKGEVSDPVLTQFGYHLIQVVDKRTSPNRPLDQVRTEIEMRLKQQKTQEAIQDQVEELREKAEFKKP